MPEPFSLKLLGGVSVVSAAGPLSGPATQRRRLALLALIAAAPNGGVSRARVAGLLFPEYDDERANGAVSDALHGIRRTLGKQAILAAGPELRLNPAVVGSDLAEFTTAVATGAWEAALRVYRGPFMDGFFLPSAPEFEHWLDGERDRLARHFEEALTALAEQRESVGDVAGACDIWRRAAAHDPYSARVAVRLMTALVRAGDASAAVRHAGTYEVVVRQQLEIEPDAAVRAFAQQIGAALPSGDTPAERPHSTTIPPETGPPEPWTASAARGPALMKRKPFRLVPLAVGILGLTAVVLGVRNADHVLRAAAMSGESLDPPPRGSLAAVGALERQPYLLIADFAAHGDTTIGTVVSEALRADLETSRAVTAFPAGVLNEALRRMQLAAGTPVRGAIAHELAVREAIPVRLEGDVHRVGNAYQLTAHLVATADGGTLASFRETAGSSEQLVRAVGRLSKAVRARLGESVRNLRMAPALEKATTASLPALQQYSLARRAMRHGDSRAAEELLQQAVALDSTFAMAFSVLARLCEVRCDAERAEHYRMRAFQHRMKLPDFERYMIEGVHWRLAGERESADAAWRAALEIQPRHVGVLNNLAALYGVREPDRFAAMAERAFRADSTAPPSATNYAAALFRQGRYDEASRVLGVPTSQVFGLQLTDALMLASQGEYARAERRLLELWSSARGTPQRHRNVAWALAAVTATQGRLRQSLEWMGETKLDPSTARSDSLRADLVALLVERYITGDTGRAQRRLTQVVARYAPDRMPVSTRPLLPLAQAYSAVGLHSAARVVLRVYEDSIPRAQRWPQQRTHHMINGMNALADRDHGLAAREFTLTGREGCRTCEHYGQALLLDLAGRTDSAIVIYEGYVALREPWRLWEDSFWLGAILERLAQLNAETGNADKAVHYHERFAALWQNADPELQPRVRAARAAAGRLRDGRSSSPP